MELNDYDARLPEPGRIDSDLFGPQSFGGRMLRRLSELFRQNAVVTREIQYPPILHVAKDDGDMTIATATNTKVTHNVIEVDTHGWWDATNSKWTPRESGYYLFHLAAAWESDATAIPAAGFAVKLYKNGSAVKRGYASKDFSSATVQLFTTALTAIMYHDANPNKSGGADYWEHYVSQNTGGNQTLQGQAAADTYFCAQFLGGKRPNVE